MTLGLLVLKGGSPMKIVKKPVDREDLTREFTCDCGALLGVSPGDVQSSSGMDYGGGYDTSYYFTGPLCQKTTSVARWWLKRG